MRAIHRVGLITLLTLSVAASAEAQRGGGGFGGSVPSSSMEDFTRLERLELVFTLDRDQKREVKNLFDATHKSAAPIREGLTKTRDALGNAIKAARPQEEIDAAIRAYAEQSTKMVELEAKSLAELLAMLTPEQRGNGAAIQTAFFLVRGMFLDNRRWDAVPTSRLY